jgi:hypothetical protein
VINLKKKQIFLINKTKNFIKIKIKKTKVSNPSLYFSTFGLSVGYLNLLMWIKNKKLSFLLLCTFIKNFFSIGFLSDFYIKKDHRFKNIKYDSLIISWIDYGQKINRFYKDKYFNLEVNNSKNSCFFYIGTKENSKILPNSVIISPGIKKFNLFFFLKIIFNFLKSNKFNFLRLNELNSTNIYAEILFEAIRNNIDLKKIKKVFVPYEGQPHQNYILFNIKKINNKLITIGYVHAGLPALPTNYIKRRGHPDKILVNGISQKEIMHKFLGWKNTDIILTPSLRFNNTNICRKSGIYLPIFLDNLKLTTIFEDFLKLFQNKKLYPLKIFNHPSTKESNIHLEFIKRLKITLKKYKNLFSKKEKNNKYLICFGPTSSPLLFLEGKNKVFHITERAEFDIFCLGYSNYIELKKINNFVYQYHIKKFNTLINTLKFNFKVNHVLSN